jgi:putative transposase
MKLHVDPKARGKVQEEMARLYDIPRIREITGTIVNLELRPGEHIEQADFVGHERAALTSFDHEILSSRPPIKRETRERRRDRRDAGSTVATETPTEPTLRRRLPKEKSK